MAFKDRIEFTRSLVLLLTQMIEEEEFPIIDFVKRSAEEQKRLFQEGLSKCDGEKIRSRHQDGKACDIYFIENGNVVEPQKGHIYWHIQWEELGGRPMIEWDRGHFE